MSVSDIAVTALTAVATVKGNQLTITTSDPRSGALQNIALDHVDIYASQTDTFASASVVTQGTLRALHADAGEEQTWYYWGIPYDRLGAAGTRYPSGATGGVACTSLGQAGLPFVLVNGEIIADTHSSDAAVASGAIRFSIKTLAGNDPSVSNPVFLAFPHATLTIARYQTRAITAALNIIISSGSEMGLLATSLPFHIWFPLFDDAGTLRMGVCLRSYAGGTVLPLFDGGSASSTAEGGAGAADGTLIYTGTAVTSKPYRVLGYAEWSTGLAAIGTWTAPDIIRLAPPGVRPGAVVQEFFSEDASPNSTTTLIPWDNTIPQKTEGGSWLSGLPMTPFSAANWFEFDVLLNCAHSVASELICAVFRDTESDAIGCGVSYVATANTPTQIRVRFRVLALSTAARTFAVRFGPSTAGTMFINGASGAQKLNGTLFSSTRISEIWG